MLLWLLGGFFVGFADTLYELIINTATTIITFLMVFLIQSSQNRDTAAINLKLDELIKVNELARNSMINLEDRTEAEQLEVKKEFGV